MGLKCICLSDEFIGADSAVLCRKSIAKRRGYKCPRHHDPWVIHQSCFDLMRLVQKSRAETEAMFRPASAAIAGDGLPDEKPETISATIVESTGILEDSL